MAITTSTDLFDCASGRAALLLDEGGQKFVATTFIVRRSGQRLIRNALVLAFSAWCQKIACLFLRTIGNIGIR